MVRFFEATGGRNQKEFLDLPYSEISFLYEMIQEKDIKEHRDRLEAVSFNAWQQLATKGVLKKGTSFEIYKKQLGLVAPKSSKIEVEELAAVANNAFTIMAQLQKVKNGKQKNI